ncbi:MAG: OmpA family protein [Calditrichaeota bacterium]|nr:MAG: OmpA family protein [Calditrichota bacterium]
MNRKWIFIGFLFLLFSQINSVQGQYKRGSFSIGLQAGAQDYFGDVERSSLGPAVAGVVRFMVRPYLGLQLNTGYGELRDDVHHRSFYTDILDAKLNLVFMFYQNARVAPMVYVGAGGFKYSAYAGNRTDLLQTADGTEANGWEEVAVLGVGIEAFLTPMWSFQFSGDYHYAFSDKLDGQIARNDYDGFLNARVTLLFNFKGDRDTDGDGIFDREDFEPKKEEDFDGFQDWDGAPDPDNDEDGILDYADTAPNEPEDVDGFEDYDGAPDTDNDHDGIPDITDLAPNEPEDYDGFQDEDGKPDLDNDGDGIPDIRDGAINSPEDFDGFEDEDGIPDWDNDADSIPDSLDGAPLLPENINGYQDDDGIPEKDPWLKAGEKRILQGISFNSGSATLTSASYQALNTIAKELMADRSIQLDVQGYTDDRGRETSNLKLSLKRANSVRSFLISKGIKSRRLMATGFGESAPIAPNDNAEGRRANRRIEIVRIK